MNEEEAIAYFRSQLIATARALPLGDAINFLRGALAVALDHESMAEIRSVYRTLVAADAQLELLADPQTKLNLDGDNGRSGGSQ